MRKNQNSVLERETSFRWTLRLWQRKTEDFGRKMQVIVAERRMHFWSQQELFLILVRVQMKIDFGQQVLCLMKMGILVAWS